MADAVKDLLKRGQAKDAAVLIDETEEKTIDASSAEYEEDGYGEIYVEYNYSAEDFDKLRYLARSEDKEGVFRRLQKGSGRRRSQRCLVEKLYLSGRTIHSAANGTELHKKVKIKKKANSLWVFENGI